MKFMSQKLYTDLGLQENSEDKEIVHALVQHFEDYFSKVHPLNLERFSEDSRYGGLFLAEKVPYPVWLLDSHIEKLTRHGFVLLCMIFYRRHVNVR